MNLPQIAKNAGHLLKHHSPTVLTGVAVAGLASSIVLAVRATPQALSNMSDAWDLKNERNTISEDLTPVEIVKATWKVYIPAALTGATTAACIIGVNAVHIRRQAALVGAYSILETGAREYQARMAEAAPAKDREVRDEMAAEKLKVAPPTAGNVFIPNNGDVLFYESQTGRYFMSNRNKVDKAINAINAKVHQAVYASQNDLFTLIGLPPTTLGDELGWSNEHTLEVDFSSHLIDDDNSPYDGQAAVVMEYYNQPIKDYWRIYK